MKRAIISVSNKSGVVKFAKSLSEMGYEIVSTGGTFRTLREGGVNAIYVTEITGFPEILDGRVKTLNPYVHGGILAKRTPEHLQQLAENKITPIDIVVVNLYPFKETIAKPGVTFADAIENIDIGGPAMVRASAKNHEYVTIIVNPGNYDPIIEELQAKGEVSGETRRRLALEAFTHTAEYDTAISGYLSKEVAGEEILPQMFTISGSKLQELRYGENPHQKAAFYKENVTGLSLAGAKQLQGKELSYNNIVDLQAAFDIAREFAEPVAVIIKHTNPCGVALGKTLVDAYLRAYEADPVSAFGGIVGLNKPVDKATATELAKLFLEAVIAPEFTPEAREIMASKANVRLMETGPWENITQDAEVKKISGGFLVQTKDTAMVKAEDLKVVTQTKPTSEDVEELLFAWKIVKHVKSNAIVLTKGKQTLGVGAGQMNRVGAANIALEQAGEKAKGAYLSSDAFFPFNDTVALAAKFGIKAIIQPGGSIRDVDSITVADNKGMSMVFTGMRHFKH